MFIHFGLYSQLGRHEWAMEQEGIPVAEYEQLARHFNPKPHAAREWAKLAKRAGMKYMVMTTKHHEGFCLFDTKLTNYCAPKQAAGRDLVAEFVEAVRGEGLHVGFYYSLMDWHHPDGAICATDEAARRRFVDYIHGHVRELCTNYGKLDVLWYDVNWPLKPEGWESVELNKMVRQLQPDILINNRSGIPEDFTTPEQRIVASAAPWEACMTMNDSWGFNRGDDNWKSPKNGRPEPADLYTRPGQLSAEHRSARRRFDPRAIRRNSEHSGPLDGQTRGVNSPFGPVRRPSVGIGAIYPKGQYPLHSCTFLAGLDLGGRRLEAESAFRQNVCVRPSGKVRTGRFPRTIQRITGGCA